MTPIILIVLAIIFLGLYFQMSSLKWNCTEIQSWFVSLQLGRPIKSSLWKLQSLLVFSKCPPHRPIRHHVSKKKKKKTVLQAELYYCKATAIYHPPIRNVLMFLTCCRWNTAAWNKPITTNTNRPSIKLVTVSVSTLCEDVCTVQNWCCLLW